jgi:N-sulfoglucosamine sulfohydrolase
VAHGKNDVGRHGFDVTGDNYDAETIENFLMTRNTNQPLCLFVGTHQPHVPWPRNDGYDPALVKLPPTFVDTPETREFRCRYYTDVTLADTELGAVMDLAAKHLVPTNTLVLYTSDHGGQWPFGKWNLYDAGVAAPMIAAWPGVIKPGRRTDAMVQWIDLLPTLIETGGGQLPEGLDGQSFLPVLTGKKSAHRDVIFTTHSGDGRMNVYPIRAIRTDDWKLILNLHPEFAHTTHIDKALAKDGGAYWMSWFEVAKTNPAAATKVKATTNVPPSNFTTFAPIPSRRTISPPTQRSPLASEICAHSLRTWMKGQGDQADGVQRTPLVKRSRLDPAGPQQRHGPARPPKPNNNVP